MQKIAKGEGTYPWEIMASIMSVCVANGAAGIQYKEGKKYDSHIAAPVLHFLQTYMKGMMFGRVLEDVGGPNIYQLAAMTTDWVKLILILIII